MPQLNARQLRFVEQYMLDLNGKQAAIRAGYSARSAEVTASQLLRIPKVAQSVAAAMQRAAERAEISVAQVIQRLDDVAGRAKGDDDRVNEIRSLELLGRHVGAFEDRLRISGNLSNLSDEELERRINERLEQRAAD